ncbi:MAG: hypothetical protein AAF611_16925 [Bacteroidota bacterium]
MRKKEIKSLRLTKSVISNFNADKAKGGVSGACTSSVDPHHCNFACPESVYIACN